MQRESTEAEDLTPPYVILWICPVCGRKEFSDTGWRRRHHSRGARCPGTPTPMQYIYQGVAEEP